jgi:MFS transporter, DHA1 family, inner membrane transport protein
MPLALLALAISAFAIGTTEFVPTGLLPEIAADFHVDIPTAGLLVSGYALGVFVGAPLLSAAATPLRRKPVLLGLLGLFVIGNIGSALASDYTMMMISRVVASLCHGAFFGVGSVVAAGLVAPQRRAAAIATMFAGITLANVLGVPLGTLLGQSFGWRSTFWAVAALGIAGALGVLALVPDRPADPAANLRGELSSFRCPQVWLALGMTALGFGGVFASFTYVAPLMVDVAGFPASALTWLVLLFGAGLVVGNLAGAKAADRALMPAIIGTIGALAVALALFVVTVHSPIPAAITLFVVGAAAFATAPGLQTRVIEAAGTAGTMASAANIGAFNLGNAIGAWLGGLVIDAGLGYPAANGVGATMAVAGVLVALGSVALDRRRRRTPVAA